MKIDPARIDRVSYERETFHQKEVADYFFKLADAIRNDPDKQQRLTKPECPVCFYRGGRIGGAALTTRPCGVCEADMHFGNTCTDVVCENCAKKLGICKHCGADVNLRIRRKAFKEQQQDG